MKTEHVKTPATTEEMSSRGVEERVKRHKSQRSAPFAKENRGRIGKKVEKTTCKPAEQEENHEKGPRRSRAGNQMGNPDEDSAKTQTAAIFRRPVQCIAGQNQSRNGRTSFQMSAPSVRSFTDTGIRLSLTSRTGDA